MGAQVMPPCGALLWGESATPGQCTELRLAAGGLRTSWFDLWPGGQAHLSMEERPSLMLGQTLPYAPVDHNHLDWPLGPVVLL